MTAGSPRRTRADALRNREHLLAAARRVFGVGGAGASLDAVAREAGVGIATLYRHFPTRETLFEAVYRQEVEHLAGLADALAASDASPSEALRRWMRANVEFVATKKGMSAAMAVAAAPGSELMNYVTGRLTGAIALLLERGVAASEIRDDIQADDVLRALIGMCMLDSGPGWRESVLRLVDVFADGLRARRA